MADTTREPRSLMTDLRLALAEGRQQIARGERLKLGDLMSSLGNSGAPVTALLLALPFVSPLSLGPITTPISVLIMLISLNLLRGRDKFPLPAKYLKVHVPPSLFRLMRRVIAKLSRWFRWHTMPVAPPTTAGNRDPFRVACAVGVLVGALLLAVPIPMLPMTNTFAALAIIAFCVAHLRCGRREFLWGIGFTITSLVIFAIFGIVVYVLGMEGLRALMGGN